MAYSEKIIFMLLLTLDLGFAAQRNTRHFPVPQAFRDRNWIQVGQDELKRALGWKPNNNIAKNVILFIGDGLGLNTVFASRVYDGQYKKGESGEENTLEFEKFPNVGLSKTYCVDHQVCDSAGTGTAYLAGQKSKYGTLGVNQEITRFNCSNQDEFRIPTMLDWSQEAGKWTGIVTTARVTHASPAAAYAHSAERAWESDADFLNPKKFGPENIQYNCSDIARQLVEENLDIRVVLGGGRGKMLPNTMVDPEYPNKKGSRLDGRNLIQTWENSQSAKGRSSQYVWNKQQFDQFDVTSKDYLMGLFEPSHMQYEIERNQTMEPSLTEMVDKSIKMLQRGPKGYFLFVESARIDHAHHDVLARKALDETSELSRAVKKAVDMTSSSDTLIIVSADHSLSFTTMGYTGRGNDILGIVDTDIDIEPAYDGLPYLALQYGNGPGGLYNTSRKNVTNDDTTNKDYNQQSLFVSKYATHSGEDVPIYATGPMAHLFHGVHEQSYIAHVMGYASCVGPNKDHCKSTGNNKPPEVTCSSRRNELSILLIGLVMVLLRFIKF